MNWLGMKRLARSAGLTGLAILMTSGSVGAYSLMDTTPGSRLTMTLAMQALLGNQPVSNAMAQWNQVGIGPGPDQAFFVAQTGGTTGSCGRDKVNQVTWSATDCGLAFGNSTLAVTTTWSSSGKVVEVDILFNNAKSWSSYDGPLRFNANGTSINDLNRVALHELGHAAGLDHPDDAGQSVNSVMNSRISNTYTLQPDDIAGAHALAWQGSAAASSPPVCVLSATPASISAGGSATLATSCSPAATSYAWTNTGFSSSASGGIVAPIVSTNYSVTGSNAAGAGNVASTTVTVAASTLIPDLEVTGLTAPASGIAGGQITVTVTARNRGNLTAQPFRLGFYLSADPVINLNDLLISTCFFSGGLNAGQSIPCTMALTIPAGIAPGTYILGAFADDDLRISESDETNNARAATSGSLVISAAALPPPSCVLTASPALISPGGTAILTASCSPAATSYLWTNSIFNASAASGAVSPAVTTNYTVAGVNASGAGSPASATVSVASAGTAPSYADLWWAGSAENGWGMSIQQHGNNLFNALYVYDSAGQPAWYVMPQGTWNAAFTSYSGLIYQPTSSPLNSYSPASFVPGAAVGSVTISFSGTSNAILQYVINGVTGQKAIQRQVFGNGTAPLNVGDMWWGGTSQNGWGISISQQGGILFGAWYTYGPDGRVTWYVLPNGTWNGSTYSGPFYSTTSSSWAGVNYNAGQLAVTQAGTMSINFSGPGNAVMTYSFISGPFAGTTQSRAIVRQTF